jgi:hypothetical protein
MKNTELKPSQMIYGNKGNVWTNTAHIYESGLGNLCGTPALATNHARLNEIKVAGCVECSKEYSELMEHQHWIDKKEDLMAG